VLLLHFPFEGYTIEHLVVTRYGHGRCPQNTKEEIMAFSAEQLTHSVQQTIQCSNEYEEQRLLFDKWESKSPIVPWFGSVLHTFIVLFFITCLGVMWLWIFREMREKQS
jgi:hypothetical protein